MKWAIPPVISARDVLRAGIVQEYKTDQQATTNSPQLPREARITDHLWTLEDVAKLAD